MCISFFTRRACRMCCGVVPISPQVCDPPVRDRVPGVPVTGDARSNAESYSLWTRTVSLGLFRLRSFVPEAPCLLRWPYMRLNKTSWTVEIFGIGARPTLPRHQARAGRR